MKVIELYNAMIKNEYWDFRVYDESGNKSLGFCNSVYPWDEIPWDVQMSEVIAFTPVNSGISVRIKDPFPERPEFALCKEFVF